MIEFTEYHQAFLRDNFERLGRKKCAERLNVSESTIYRWVGLLGIAKAKPRKEVKAVEVTKPAVTAEIGYCVDCQHYILGGQCGKTGRLTGALNEKPCFKRNTL